MNPKDASRKFFHHISMYQICEGVKAQEHLTQALVYAGYLAGQFKEA